MAIPESAKICVVSSRRRSRSNYKSVHLLVSNRIYWKVTDGHAVKKPFSFSDFRDPDSLELTRLGDGTWCDVHKVVKEENCGSRRYITAQGRLHARLKRDNPLLARHVEIEIVADTLEQHEAWLDQIRARVVPWTLLQQQIQDIANYSPSRGVEELRNGLGRLVQSNVAGMPSLLSTGRVEEKWIDNLGKLPEQMEKLTIVDNLVAQGTTGVETGATLAKLVASVQQVAETAEFMADVWKCVSGVSTIFNLVALGAQGVSMCAEASRGRRVLPVALGRVVILLRYVLESLAEIMRPSQDVDEIYKDFVFSVLKETICTMDIAEAQLLRRWDGQIVKATCVQEVERKMKELERLVVTARTISKGCVLTRKIEQLEQERKSCDDEFHHVRPSAPVFFAGRTRELGILKSKLNKWGSTVITQYGGVGKTALMAAFADRAKRDELVPGGVFWVTADGGERDVVGSLARLVEKLMKKRIGERERRNPNFVITKLKQALHQRQGRWLLCLDNADNSEVSGVLNEVCEIPVPEQDDGWVLVTSRQGQPRVCSRMKSDQELVLEPLCEEDAMVALWRQSQSIKTSEQDDDEVMKDIRELEVEDRVEYCALQDLCREEGGHGLGGLPLALVQAGSFIARFKYSFTKYLNLFKAADNKEDLQDIMKNTEDLTPIRDSQRSIWTTWRISVERLSREAYTVLRGMAMVGEGGIGEAIVNGILKAATGYEGGRIESKVRNIVVEELVYGSSLVCLEERGEEERVYRMHRLVRRFILGGIERGSDAWNQVYGCALVSVHKVVETELKSEGSSFNELPDIFRNSHRKFIGHTLALVDHYELPLLGSVNLHASIVEDIHFYCGYTTRFFDSPQKQVHVWERLLRIYQHRQVENQKRKRIVRFLDVRNHRNRERETNRRIADVYSLLGTALRKMGSFDEAVFKLERSLEIRQAIHGRGKAHLEIADSLYSLAVVFDYQGKYEQAAELHEQGLEMYRAFHGAESMHPDIARSLCHLAEVYRCQEKLNEALKMQKQSLEMRQAIHGHDQVHPDIADSFYYLALVYDHQEKYNEAAALYEKCLEMDRTIYGADSMHSYIARSLSCIANVYRLQRKLDEALELHRQSLEMKRAIHGQDSMHADIAHSLYDLALVYEDQENYDQASKLFERSLEIYRKVHGANSMHPYIAYSLCRLGNVYRLQGKLDEALELHKQSLEMKRAIHGQDSMHAEIAHSLYNLAFVYEDQENYDQAAKLCLQSLQMYRKVHGSDSMHSDIVFSLFSLANVHQRQGKLEEALKIHEECLEMKRKIYGDDKMHAEIAHSLNDLASVYEDQENYDQAAKLYLQSLQMYRKVHGSDSMHSDIVFSLFSLANVYRRQGKLDEALKTHAECLEMKRKIYGCDKMHESISDSLYFLALVYEDQENYDQAAKLYLQSLQMYRKVHGSNSVYSDIVFSLSSLANVYRRQGKFEEALKAHEECLEMKRKIYGDDKMHAEIAHSLYNLASVYEDQENYNQAAKLYLQGLQMYRKVHGSNSMHSNIVFSLFSLANVYRLLGKLDEALKMHEECLEMKRKIHGDDKMHESISDSLYYLAFVHEDQGNYDQAAELHEQSLQMDRTLHGADWVHSDIAYSLSCLANVYRKQGKLEEALKMHQESLEMRRAIHVDDRMHLEIAESLNFLGLVYYDQENYGQAVELYEQSLEIYRTLRGTKPMRSNIASSLCNLANVYREQGNLDQALEMHEQSLGMKRAIHGHNESHPNIAFSLWSIGLVFRKQKKMDQAVELLEQSVEMLRNVHGRDSVHPNITAILSNLADINNAQGK